MAISAKARLVSIGLIAQSMLLCVPSTAKDAGPVSVAKPAPASLKGTSPSGKTDKNAEKPGAVAPSGPGSLGYRVEASSNYAGTLSCQLCKEGIRVKSDRMGLTWILQAPKWNAQIYNTSTECYMDLSYDEWTKRQSFMPMAKKKTKLKLEKTNNTKEMHGMKVRQYLIMATFEGPPPNMAALMGKPGVPPAKAVAPKPGKVEPTTVREAEMWIAKDPCIPKQFNELMSKIFGIPAEEGLPLSIILRQKNGKFNSIWETVKLTKSNISKDEFKPILGYKKVKTEVEMMLGDQDMGLGDDSDLGGKPVKRPKLDEMP